MKLKLTDLDPRLLKRVSAVDFEPTDDVGEAAALQLQCPACHWAGRRTGANSSHMILLWSDPPRWGFAGSGCRDLSVTAGPVTVGVLASHARFCISNGKVDFC